MMLVLGMVAMIDDWNDASVKAIDPATTPSVRSKSAIDAALRAAIPREPSEETLEAMARAMTKGQFDDPRYWGSDALRVYRAQPIWQALWGEK